MSTLYIRVKDSILLNIVPALLQGISRVKNKVVDALKKLQKTIIVLKDGRGPPVSKKLRGRKEAHKKS